MYFFLFLAPTWGSNHTGPYITPLRNPTGPMFEFRKKSKGGTKFFSVQQEKKETVHFSANHTL